MTTMLVSNVRTTPMPAAGTGGTGVEANPRVDPR
jgi:hypothetical protein